MLEPPRRLASTPVLSGIAVLPLILGFDRSALAFVPSPCTPIYCATKAAIHSYTQSLRFQLEGAGVEVIEIMPPAVHTDMTVDLSEGVTKITPQELVKLCFKSLKDGASEILPGQAKQLAFMRRLAPNFIGRVLWKAAEKQVPAGSDTPALTPPR